MSILLSYAERVALSKRKAQARERAKDTVEHLMSQRMPAQGYAFIMDAVAGNGYTAEQQEQINSVVCRLVQGLPVTAEDVNTFMTRDQMVAVVTKEIHNSYGCAQ